MSSDDEEIRAQPLLEEAAYLVEARRKLRWAEDLGHLKFNGREVIDVGLRGWKPETVLFVRFLDRGREREMQWEVWSPDSVGAVATGTIVYANVTDPKM